MTGCIPSRRRLLLCATVLLQMAMCACAAQVRADEPAAASVLGPTYELDPRIDLPILAAQLVVAGGWMLGPQLAPPYCAPQCDRTQLPFVDRFAAGWYSKDWVRVADIAVATQIVLAGSTLLIDEGIGPALNDAVIVAQAIAGSLALSVLSNTGTRRPRPHVYGDESPLEDRMSGQAALSFFSGHTATTFAAAVSTFETLRRRYPGRAVNYVVLGVGLGVGGLVGSARLAGGQHFLTDVIAGALVGSALGLLVPALHKTPVRLQLSPQGAGLGLSMPLL